MKEKYKSDIIKINSNIEHFEYYKDAIILELLSFLI